MTWPWRRSRKDRDLDDEIRGHLAQSVQSRIAAGESRDEAERAARLEFGNVTHVREVTREMWGWTSVDAFAQDIRDAARSIRRSPGVAAAAVLSLALGTGANTAIFRVMNALMFKSMPISAPGGLYALVTADDTRAGSWGVWPYTWFEKFRDRMQDTSGLAASAITHRAFVTIYGAGGEWREPEPVTVTMVSGNYFSLLGLAPQRGRLIAPADDAPGSHDAVIIISDRYWSTRFGRADDVLGRSVSIGTTLFQIIGVAPSGFTGDVVGDETMLWTPIALQSEVVAERPGLLTSDWESGWAWVRIVGRLRPGVTPESAGLEASRTLTAFEQEHFPSATRPDLRKLVFRPAGTGESPDLEALGQPVVILMVAVGLVLLIACANVANLLIARGLAREREFAVRAALGARRIRLVRQLLIETLLLSGAGAACGLVVSNWTTAVLMPLVNGENSHSGIDAALDRNIVLFAVLLATATGVLFGVVPAWRATRARLSLLARSERSVAMVSSHRHIGAGRPSRALVVVQVALAIALLVGAHLFAETLGGLKSADLGIERSHLLLVWVGGSNVSGSSGATTMARFALLQERLSALPGVISASASEMGILSNWDASGNPSEDITADGVQVRPGLRWASSTVGPRFFATVGTSLVAGRDFTPADVSSGVPVVIINETLSRFVFGVVSPLGHRLLINCTSCVPIEVIGVARDITQTSPRQGAFGVVYHAGRQSQFRATTPIFVAVRTAGDPMSQAAAVRGTIEKIAPEVPVLRIETVDARLNTLLSTDRMMALLGGAFSGLALMLAAVGLYGVISYAGLRRRSEIGLRLVLGATRWRVVRMVLRDHAALLVAGVALGWLLAAFGSRLVTSRLYGVSAGDMRAYITAIASLGAVAVVATLVPAWRASRLDPAETLRSE
jgi:predicted permease